VRPLAIDHPFAQFAFAVDHRLLRCGWVPPAREP
jgi:hypothetical protein